MTPLDQSEELTIQVRFNKSDLFSAVVLNSMRQPWFWIAPFTIGFLVYRPLSEYWYGVIIALAVGLFFFALIPYSGARTSWKTPGVLAPITYTFSVDGVSAQYETAKNSAAWSLVKGASETDKFIFIKMQRGSFHLVPKRQITQDQATLLRQLLRKHVPAKVRLSN